MRTAALWLGVLLCASTAHAGPYIVVQVQPQEHVFEVCGEWWCATWIENTQRAGDFACVIHISASLSPETRASVEAGMRAACANPTLAGAR